MNEIALEWFTRHWLEIGSFFVTCAALFYAHLAYRTSMRGLDQAKLAELNSLRIQTKAGLNDARQALVSLELNCQIYRSNWVRYERTQPITLSGSSGLFEHSPIDAVLVEGRQLLQQLDASSRNVDEMSLQALEALLQRAKVTSLSIQSVAGRLESPP